MTGQGLAAAFIGVSCIVFLLALLYWLHEIGTEVNNALPDWQRVEWNLLQMVPPFKIHWIWREHARLYPKSRKRVYVVLSLFLLFIVPIAAVLSGLMS